MPKLKTVEGSRLVKFLSKRGFQAVHQRGSHIFLKNEDGICETVPIHPGRKLPRGLILQILANTWISKETYNAEV